MTLQEDGPIARHLRALRAALAHDPLLARRVCEEAADHLAEVAAEERRLGMNPHDAEERAVQRFGPAAEVAGRFERFGAPLRGVFALGAVATGTIALWLVSVIAWVLPARDPERVPLWTGITIGFALYTALSVTFAARGPRPPALRVLVAAGSLAALGFGVWLAGSALLAARRGTHFEGYLLLMGLVLAAHAGSALAYVAFTLAVARRVRAA